MNGESFAYFRWVTDCPVLRYAVRHCSECSQLCREMWAQGDR